MAIRASNKGYPKLHEERAAKRHYVNQPTRPNFTSNYHGVSVRLAECLLRDCTTSPINRQQHWLVATPRSQVLLLSKQEETSLSLGLRSDVWRPRPLAGRRRGAAQTFISKVHKKKIKCNSQENSSYTLHSFQTPLWFRRRQQDRFFSNILNRKFETCSTFFTLDYCLLL